MATLKQQILDAVRNEDGRITNQQIATRLGANEPSVRRAMKELEREGLVRSEGYTDYQTGQIGWVPVPTPSFGSVVPQASY